MVDPGILEWAGVAAVKNAYRVFQERGFRSRVLVAAFLQRAAVVRVPGR
ncbi:hypothetical protein Q9Q99_17760 [Curtobacterium flaccumfaciens]|nr:hypothetical protein Q9Q99_17760 [Curtobacterium flaccumfaciens]